jgi:hypothetical protein
MRQKTKVAINKVVDFILSFIFILKINLVYNKIKYIKNK